MNRFKLAEHKKLKHNNIINVATGNKIGEVVWAHEKDEFPNHIRITDVNKEFTNVDLLELVNMMIYPSDYYEYSNHIIKK